jgi:hypothetical protein
MKKLIAFLVPLLLCSCATSSGVFNVSPDTYRVTNTIPSFGGIGKARGEGINLATAYCAKLGKVPIITEATVNSDFVQGGSSDVTFKCETANSVP